MSWPLADTADSERRSLYLEMEAKRREAQDRWAEFEKERQPIVEAVASGKESTKEALAKAQAFQERYHEARDAAQNAEEAFMEYVDRAERGRSSGPQRLDGIAKAFIQKMGGDAAKAVSDPSGGSLVPSFFDARIRDLPQRALFVRSLIPTKAITSDAATFVRRPWRIIRRPLSRRARRSRPRRTRT
jgi:HK97 family phage major capsid protein